MNSHKDIPTAFASWVAEKPKNSIYVDITHQYHVDHSLCISQNLPSITAKEHLEAMKRTEQWILAKLDSKSVIVRSFLIRYEER